MENYCKNIGIGIVEIARRQSTIMLLEIKRACERKLSFKKPRKISIINIGS